MADLLDAIIERLSRHTVAIVHKIEGAIGGAVHGSGVLATIDGRRGILTCGHVAEKYEKLRDTRIVFLIGENTYKYDLQYLNVILESSKFFEDSEKVFDLAFTQLPPDLAASIEAGRGVFLNLDKNREKMEAFASTRGDWVDVALGVIAKCSGEPTVEKDRVITNLRATIYTGRVTPTENGLQIFKLDAPAEKLPDHFGGMSGGGLWRMYYERRRDELALTDGMLWGIASWAWHAEGKLAAQGWERIDQGLIPFVKKAPVI